MSGEKLSLFTSLAVNKQPKTDKSTELVRVIQSTVTSTPIGNFEQLVADLNTAGIVIGTNNIAIKADKVSVVNGSTTTAMFSGGKLNAALIDAGTITVNHLWAKSAEGGTIVGHFGNYDINAAVVGSVKYPLWIGANTASDAPFRVSKDGAIYATSGKIGCFDISHYVDGTNFDFYNLSAKHWGSGQIPSCTTEIDYEGIHVGSGTYTNGGTVRIGYGGGIVGPSPSSPTWSNGVMSVECNFSAGANSDQIGINCDVVGKSGYTANGLKINVTGGSNNYAIKIEDGVVAGFRPKIRTVSSSTTLDVIDHTIYCTNTSAITLTLPSSPKLGQEYLIIQGNARVNISASHTIYGKGSQNTKTWYSDTGSQFSIFVFTGSVWRVNYMS